VLAAAVHARHKPRRRVRRHHPECAARNPASAARSTRLCLRLLQRRLTGRNALPLRFIQRGLQLRCVNGHSPAARSGWRRRRRPLLLLLLLLLLQLLGRRLWLPPLLLLRLLPHLWRLHGLAVGLPQQVAHGSARRQGLAGGSALVPGGVLRRPRLCACEAAAGDQPKQHARRFVSTQDAAHGAGAQHALHVALNMHCMLLHG
jgi:hypothetical protein